MDSQSSNKPDSRFYRNASNINTIIVIVTIILSLALGINLAASYKGNGRRYDAKPTKTPVVYVPFSVQSPVSN